MTLRLRLYNTLLNLNKGVVKCFICNEKVLEDEATIEHIVPKSKGGTNYLNNLSISHLKCNQNRKNKEFNKEQDTTDIKYTVTYEELKGETECIFQQQQR